MTAAKWQFAGILTALAVAVGVFLHVRADAHTSTVAARAQADDVTLAQHWQAVADTAQGKVRIDTIHLTRTLTRAETTLARIVDTAIVHHHDTVSVPVTVLVQADSAIKVCRVTVADCTAYGVAQKARGDALQAALTESDKQKPDWLQRHLSLAGGYGCTVSGGKTGCGPGVLAGFRFWP